MKYFEAVLIIGLVSRAISMHIDVENIEHFDENLSRAFNDKFRDFVEHKMREIMRNGNPGLDIPVLDPLKGVEDEFDIQVGKIMVAGKVQNYYVGHLANYTVKETNSNLIKRKLYVSLHFSTIKADGRYQLSGSAAENVPIYGSGEFDMTATDFSLATTIYFSIVNGVRVKSMDLQIKLGKLNMKMTGLMNDEDVSWVLSEVISDLAPQAIDEYHDQITGYVTEKAIDGINEKLKGKSISDLVSIIS